MALNAISFLVIVVFSIMTGSKNIAGSQLKERVLV